MEKGKRPGSTAERACLGGLCTNLKGILGRRRSTRAQESGLWGGGIETPSGFRLLSKWSRIPGRKCWYYSGMRTLATGTHFVYMS